MYPAVSTVAALLLLTNCTIDPVPEDVTGVDTYHIVRQIRCETRAAAAELVLKELRRLGSDHEDQAADPIAQRLVARDEADPNPLALSDPIFFPEQNMFRLETSTT